MKIDVLRLIEEALIGGRNGEMAYIENNPFIALLYREWRNKNKNKSPNNTFRDFLLGVLDTEQENYDTQTVITHKPITKRYNLSDYNEKYKKYRVIQEQIRDLQKDRQDILREIAESKNKALAAISTYEVKHGEYDTYIEFKVLVEEIIKIDTGETK